MVEKSLVSNLFTRLFCFKGLELPAFRKSQLVEIYFSVVKIEQIKD